MRKYYKDKRVWAERPDRYRYRKYGPKGSAEWKEAIAATRRGKKASPETRAKMSASAKGRIISPEQREKIRQSNLIAWSNPELLARHRARRATQKAPSKFWNTHPEQKLANFLERAGFRIQREKNFGHYRVDVYLLDYHLAIECDGVYWHRVTERNRPGYYANRDQVLMERFNLPIVRLTDAEILAWPNLDTSLDSSLNLK